MSNPEAVDGVADLNVNPKAEVDEDDLSESPDPVKGAADPNKILSPVDGAADLNVNPEVEEDVDDPNEIPEAVDDAADPNEIPDPVNV